MAILRMEYQETAIHHEAQLVYEMADDGAVTIDVQLLEKLALEYMNASEGVRDEMAKRGTVEMYSAIIWGAYNCGLKASPCTPPEVK